LLRTAFCRPVSVFPIFPRLPLLGKRRNGLPTSLIFTLAERVGPSSIVKVTVKTPRLGLHPPSRFFGVSFLCCRDKVYVPSCGLGGLEKHLFLPPPLFGRCPPPPTPPTTFSPFPHLPPLRPPPHPALPPLPPDIPHFFSAGPECLITIIVYPPVFPVYTPFFRNHFEASTLLRLLTDSLRSKRPCVVALCSFLFFFSHMPGVRPRHPSFHLSPLYWLYSPCFSPHGHSPSRIRLPVMR